ncbi:MAG: PAS domain-containing protein [Daejeonella sp.]
MKLLADPLFQALFNSPVPRIIVKADAPLFTIIVNNDAHKLATNLLGKDISGKSVWEVFNPAEAGGEGGNLLMNALLEAQQSNQTIFMPPFRYDMISSDRINFEIKWWQLEIIPVPGTDGKPEFLMAATHNITEQVLKQQAIEEGQRREKNLNKKLTERNENLNALNEALIAVIEKLRVSREELETLNTELEDIVSTRTRELVSNEAKFRNLIEQSPVAIAVLTGSKLIVDSVNFEMLKIWRKGQDIIGKPIINALPELEGQPYLQILSNVLRSATPYYGNEVEVTLFHNNKPETGYLNFINYPIKDKNGNIQSIMVVATDVTEQVLARRSIENSESRLFNLVMKAHYPLMILGGPDLIVDIANQEIANLWSMPLTEITGRKLLDILPEIKEQSFSDILRRVYETGISYDQKEEVLYLDTPEGINIKYINFYYDPLFDKQQKVSGVIVSANDVTEQVISRKELEKAYEKASLSKEAAMLGTFDMDFVKGIMEWDERCRELFGISHHNIVTYKGDFLPGLHEDDRERVNSLISSLLRKNTSNGDYDVEYRTIGREDGKLRWVRAKGKVFFNELDKPVRFIGSTLDITDQKRDEERKNDFIGMVSHELKTPLTSLNAYMQVLYAKARKQHDDFSIAALDKSEKQVKKMTTMINGFLSLSRLESGKLYLNKKEFNLNELIQEVIDDMVLPDPGHKISFISFKTLRVFADRDKIEHVISNLLSNSVKYSREGSTIEIKCEIRDNLALVSVKDEGIGISKSDLPKLFDRYYRVEDNNTIYISGFGIGLYLSAEIIYRHNGNIWAESDLGQGSTFYFSLSLI